MVQICIDQLLGEKASYWVKRPVTGVETSYWGQKWCKRCIRAGLQKDWILYNVLQGAVKLNNDAMMVQRCIKAVIQEDCVLYNVLQGAVKLYNDVMMVQSSCICNLAGSSAIGPAHRRKA